MTAALIFFSNRTKYYAYSPKMPIFFRILRRYFTKQSEMENKATLRKKNHKRFNLPVIGHFADRSIRFNSIHEAEYFTGINYQLIFNACVGKIFKAHNVYWEFENRIHHIKYKAFYVRTHRKLMDAEFKKQLKKDNKKKGIKAH